MVTRVLRDRQRERERGREGGREGGRGRGREIIVSTSCITHSPLRTSSLSSFNIYGKLKICS